MDTIIEPVIEIKQEIKRELKEKRQHKEFENRWNEKCLLQREARKAQRKSRNLSQRLPITFHFPTNNIWLHGTIAAFFLARSAVRIAWLLT